MRKDGKLDRGTGENIKRGSYSELSTSEIFKFMDSEVKKENSI